MGRWKGLRLRPGKGVAREEGADKGAGPLPLSPQPADKTDSPGSDGSKRGATTGTAARASPCGPLGRAILPHGGPQLGEETGWLPAAVATAEPGFLLF